MIVAHFRCDPESRAEEGAGQFGNQLLAGIAFVAPGLAAEAAVETGRVQRPVRALMHQRRVQAFGDAECLDDGYLDVIAV